NYPATYPPTFTGAQQNAAVQATCYNGVVWNIMTNSPVLDSSGAPIPLYDYAPIAGAYVELPAGTQIASETAMDRPDAIPILYRLKITQDNLLSLSYSYNGGAYQSVISGQSILASNGPLPAGLLFGFAGSTGGSTNIHEILCFTADPATTSDTSAGASEKQSAKLETGVQAFFAFYNPSTWSGRVTAAGLSFDQFGNVIVATTPNWDAACVLNGVGALGTCPTTGVAGPTPAEAPASRVMLTWSGVAGIPFQYASLTAAQQALLTAGDNPALPCNASTGYATNDRLWYLRGSRACDINSSGVGLFRARAQILGDIIDSSPTWVGPPVSPYPTRWTDRINGAAVMAENGGGAQTYPQYVTAEQSRLNVVYVGANDGWLHGFRSGSYNADGSYNNTNNDGQEVLAYMPGAVVQTIHSATANLDYSNTQYGHAFFVDATPGTGDVFFGNAWHSWVVGGLGEGGAAIYALDVTNPSPANFTEGNAPSIVLGEWTPTSLVCANVANCGNNLGNTYGTPTLRRLHDGKWAAIFGNGLKSASGDAGIYVMTIDPSTGARTFYYFSTSTGSPANPNGIAYATPVDLDGDHITDYVYAGDILGNLWRFDLTSAMEANWALTPGPVFKTQGGQPITTAIVAASGEATAGATQQLMLLFGTGQKFPQSNASPATYAAGTQSLYGVWDWNMGPWNALSASAKYASLTPAGTGLMTPNDYTTIANLQQQTVTVNAATQDREILANANVCWAGTHGCGGGAAQFGWYFNLPGAQEQIVYNPELIAQAITVNSLVPAVYSRTACTSLSDTGFTYVVSAMTGAAFNEVFLPPSEAQTSLGTDPRYTDANAIGIQTDASGSSLIVMNNAGTRFLVMETDRTQGSGANANNIADNVTGTNLPPNTTGRRLSWVERR
ncbi:MAG: pilus assembly protein PilY, partial [Gammaproteobacteria bacterium]|nr:pilus assembly protein PilY [Gammaproteobacteria bacterium]